MGPEGLSRQRPLDETALSSKFGVGVSSEVPQESFCDFRTMQCHVPVPDSQPALRSAGYVNFYQARFLDVDANRPQEAKAYYDKALRSLPNNAAGRAVTHPPRTGLHEHKIDIQTHDEVDTEVMIGSA